MLSAEVTGNRIHIPPSVQIFILKSFSEADMKLLPSKSVKSLNVTDFLVELQQLIDRLIISYVIFRAQTQTFDGFGFSDLKICCLSDMTVN